jgi:ubiquinone/menaquinone biosynthesis C-methylase UbiE
MSFDVREGYDQWSHNYDAVENKTRDLDKVATQTILLQYLLVNVLELGCGTGKNTEWLVQKAQQVTAMDFSAGMLLNAKNKIKAKNVSFVKADITKTWPFEKDSFDFATCNLILEHVKGLQHVFAEANRVLQAGGKFFISELHPFKQYTGSKARFEKQETLIVLETFTHHTAEFFNTALQNGFNCIRLDEWFDEGENEIPRLISFLFEKR